MEDEENDYGGSMKTSGVETPGGQLVTVETGLLDSARPNVARVRTTLTPKQERAARLRRENPAAPEGPVLVAAGYAVSTTRNPGANGLDSRLWLAQLEADERKAGIEVKAPTMASLKTKSLTAIDTALEPDSEIGTLARAQLGGSVVKLASEVGGEDRDDDVDARSSIMYAHRRMRLALLDVLRGIDLCVEAGVDEARATIRARLDEIPTDSYWNKEDGELVDLDARLGDDLYLIGHPGFSPRDRATVYQTHRKQGFPVPPNGTPGWRFIRDLK